ncbi:cilia- and flagella-associated protein 206-like [Myzus persicae]|uniref:cilia- and flagella-associated protein 206-like n=1 Tax=Myzus persicae TaxID=13164 RepID=UPI000B9331BF|nr:cilia- and flagella-associated protein 206-like [Myzus persicae]
MLPEEKYIRKVIQGCLELGVQVSEELASVFFKCWLLSPNVKNLQKQPLKNIMDKIIDQCIQRLSVQKDPSILCIKMQLLIEHDYKNREFIINKVNEENDQKIRPLLNDILDNVDDTGNTMSTYYQKIIQYIILSNYMGDPTSPILIQEISDALHNVLNRTKSSEFENQLPSLKINQLKEISNLVCGIWLYNMDRKDKREETLDMIDTLPNAVELLLQNIEHELRDSIKKVMMTTSWILQCYKVYTDILAPIFVIRINFATVTIKKLNDYKTVLVFYLQYKKNLEIIKEDLSKLKIELPTLLIKFNRTFKEIKKLQNTNDFGQDTIYPELNNATVIWSEIRGIMNHLSITCSLISSMKQLTNEVINISEDIDNTSIMDTILIDSEELLTIIETYPLHPMCEWHPPTSANNKHLFADGYCVVMIVETDGILIQHDKSIGVIQYSDEWFGFASIQAALHFGTKPTYYLNRFLNLMRSKPHLLSIFHLYEQMTEMQHNSNEL